MKKELQQQYHTECFKLFVKYFEHLQHENWKKLDVVVGDEVFKVQGENRLLKQLLSVKETREVKFTEHDGGFGEM